jgi:hypothetical protein
MTDEYSACTGTHYVKKLIKIRKVIWEPVRLIAPLTTPKTTPIKSNYRMFNLQ